MALLKYIMFYFSGITLLFYKMQSNLTTPIFTVFQIMLQTKIIIKLDNAVLTFSSTCENI